MSFNVNNCDLIVIHATDTESGIEAEYEYINQLYGRLGVGWELLQQRLTTCISKEGAEPLEVDILTIQLPSGEIKDVMFDISSFYGK